MWLISILPFLGTIVSAATVRTSTPLMGWDSYNYYNCYPSEEIIETNAAALVSLGLEKLGYTYVTTDCGWNADYRDSSGHLVWNSTLFPSGGEALGEYIHNLGLKFGMYSGAGHYQCGSTDQPGSLGKLPFLLHRYLSIVMRARGTWARPKLMNCSLAGYETIDADSFAEWAADSLK